MNSKQLLKRGGIVLGKDKNTIFYNGEDAHSIIMAATRFGKTRRIILPSICLTALSGENMIISDVKGELFLYTSEFLKKLGYEVHVLDFINTDLSDRYNFLEPIVKELKKGNISRAIEKVWDMVNILVEFSDKGEPIWQNGEASMVAACVMAVVWDNMNNPDYQNLANVYNFMARMCTPINIMIGDRMIQKIPLIEYIKEKRDIEPNHPCLGLITIANIAPSKTQGSFYTSALTTMKLFTTPTIADATSVSDFDINKNEGGKTAVFMILPDEKTAYYKIGSLFVSQVYEELVALARLYGDRLPVRTHFFLDEFGNFSKFNDLVAKVTAAAGRGILFHFVLQSFNQITEKYSKEVAEIVKENCQYWLYLHSDGTETNEDISKKLGNYTVASAGSSSNYNGNGFITIGNQSNSYGASTSLVSRALLTPKEIGTIRSPYTLVTSRNYPAITVAPDFSKYDFNVMCGMGGEEHNQKLKMYRQDQRKKRTSSYEINLWSKPNYWVNETTQLRYYTPKSQSR